MRVVIVGLGTQGAKRLRVAGKAVVATVDPHVGEATHRRLEDVPSDRFDAALVCTPEAAKDETLARLLADGKHVLVEKPLLLPRPRLLALESLAAKCGVVCYTAYNHRFEPHAMRMAETIRSGRLGTLYSLRLFYGNGTARDVRNSPWRDQEPGVLSDLGSHLLDLLIFWLGAVPEPLRLVVANRHENRAPDHVVACGGGRPWIEIETSLLSWRNHFSCDVYGERGSAHIEGLCKWGPSTFTVRDRVLPSGRPAEEQHTLVRPDPTWEAEYAHFTTLCAGGGPGNLRNDIAIADALHRLADAARTPSKESSA